MSIGARPPDPASTETTPSQTHWWSALAGLATHAMGGTAHSVHDTLHHLAHHEPHPHYPAHCGWLEDAEMAREMFRL